jgi:hypothetical protein
MANTTPSHAAGPSTVVTSPTGETSSAPADVTETVGQPAKILRIGTMTKQLLDEVRQSPLDDASRARLREIYETSIRELSDALSPDLQQELHRMAIPFDEGRAPSDAELRIAQAQLVGWLEGLFQGIQAALYSQQISAQNQLEEMRRRGIPAASDGRPPPTGNYL